MPQQRCMLKIMVQLMNLLQQMDVPCPCLIWIRTQAQDEAAASNLQLIGAWMAFVVPTVADELASAPRKFDSWSYPVS